MITSKQTRNINFNKEVPANVRQAQKIDSLPQYKVKLTVKLGNGKHKLNRCD